MNILLIIFAFIAIYGLMAGLIGIPLFNIVGLPGGFIGLKSTSKKEPRYLIGLLIAFVLHVYVYSAYSIYIIEWTRTKTPSEGFTKYLVWFFSMACAVGPIQKLYSDAKKENAENPTGYYKPQIQSLLFTEVFSFFFYFIVVFYPDVIDPLWTWVRNISFIF
jgi:hypothetical protein